MLPHRLQTPEHLALGKGLDFIPFGLPFLRCQSRWASLPGQSERRCFAAPRIEKTANAIQLSMRILHNVFKSHEKNLFFKSRFQSLITRRATPVSQDILPSATSAGIRS